MQPYKCLACDKRHATELEEFRCMYGKGLMSADDVAHAIHTTVKKARHIMEGGDPYAVLRRP